MYFLQLILHFLILCTEFKKRLKIEILNLEQIKFFKISLDFKIKTKRFKTQ
jgi:hypothetical protein